MQPATDELYACLRRMRLIKGDERPPLTPLAGGVSSDINRVDLHSGPVCIKRALPRLKVAAEWHAPVERNRYEVEWMRTARAIAPAFVPMIIAEDRASGAFAMEWLDPLSHPVWKAQLRDGVIEPEVAAEVGRRVGCVHHATFEDPRVKARFRTDEIFHAIRIEPYLLATARAHPECASALRALAHVTAATRCALVHGDVSPKNILVGPNGPILLDAECAWYGDPAFDLAFCLNHMLLKCLWRPHWRDRYLSCFDALATSYTSIMAPLAEPIEERAARLLPGLLLGRVDGKSPAEYVTLEADKDRVRRVSRGLLLDPPARLADVRQAWSEELAA